MNEIKLILLFLDSDGESVTVSEKVITLVKAEGYNDSDNVYWNPEVGKRCVHPNQLGEISVQIDINQTKLSSVRSECFCKEDDLEQQKYRLQEETKKELRKIFFTVQHLTSEL